MKKKGILNSSLLELIASAGHRDLIAVTDRGFPLPLKAGIKVIDLGIAEGIPSFIDVVSLLADELEVEKIIHAEESLKKCPETVSGVKNLFNTEDGFAVLRNGEIIGSVDNQEHHLKGPEIGDLIIRGNYFGKKISGELEIE